MGRTINKYDEEDRRKIKPAKHSRNIPGRGMRVINNWSEEIDSDDLDYEYNDNTSQTQRKHKGNTNGY
jgi:hypothetical protein